MQLPASVALGTALAVVLSGCAAPSDGTQEPAPTASASGQGTFVVAAAVDPLALDPAVVTDTDSLRITRQVFETLVTLPDAPEEATASPAPDGPSSGPEPVADGVAAGLATEWSVSADARSYTFVLRQGVEFHDGTPFDAAAVCTNLDRWYTLADRAAAPDASGVYQEVFGGFIDQADARYDGCTQLGPARVRVDLAVPMPGLLVELTRPQFALQSPAALAAHGAYGATEPRGTAYATTHPTGTGPFRFGAWEPGVQVVLLRNAGYWGETAAVERVLVRTVHDPKARADQLLAGQVDAYDQLTALDAGVLAADPGDEVRLVRRPAGDLAYLGMDRRSIVLADPLVRRAVAAAVDPEALVAVTMPPGSTVADRLRPGQDGTRVHPYDPVLSRRLLAEAGATDLTVRIAYPSGVQQTSLPAPEELYVAVAEQLAAVGITAQPVAMAWPAYLAELADDSAAADLHLMGVSMPTPDPGSVVTQLLAGGEEEFGIEPTSARLAALAGAPAGPDREELLAAAEEQLLAEAVVVPIAHPASSVAFGARVREASVRPYGGEVWAGVRLDG